MNCYGINEFTIECESISGKVLAFKKKDFQIVIKFSEEYNNFLKSLKDRFK